MGGDEERGVKETRRCAGGEDDRGLCGVLVWVEAKSITNITGRAVDGPHLQSERYQQLFPSRDVGWVLKWWWWWW